MAFFKCPECGEIIEKKGSHIGEADKKTYNKTCYDCTYEAYVVYIKNKNSTKTLQKIEKLEGVKEIEGFYGVMYGG